MAFCSKCGSTLAEDVKFCPECGTAVNGAPNVSQQYLPMPDSNLVWGILTTIFCFLPFGIVSIVYASKVGTYYYTGNYELARDASKKAGTWAMWSAITLVIIVAIVLIIAAIVANKAARYSLYDF